MAGRGLTARWIAGALLLGLSLGAVRPVHAHPLGKAQWSLRTAARASGDAIQVLVVVEVPFDDVGKAVREARASDASTDAGAVVAAYGQALLARMASQARLTIDGAPVPGAFVAMDHPLNGRGSAAGGFFTWIITFEPASAWPLDDDVLLEIRHTGFTEEDLVYSTFADGGAPWTVTEDSSKAVLPDRPYALEDPAFWSPDKRLRTLRARFVRGPTP